jgi:FkbM family methyltransferase
MKKKYCISECTLEPGDILVEVGANVGEFTIMASEIVQKVFAFEPDPDIFNCLEKNTRVYKNIEISECGASKANGTETFYLSGEDADSSLIKPKSFNREVKVNTVRLDTWMDSKKLDGIDFLKIEAEGAEMEVLEGLGEKISYVRKISVDGGPERYGEPTFEDVDRYLKSKGFITLVIGYHVYGWRINQ